MLILPNSNLVLRAWATLVDAAPSSIDYAEHIQFIKDYKPEGYVAALNEYASAYTDDQLAAVLLKNTGLDTIDLEGDGNNDNMAVAKAFLASNANNRVGAILDLTNELLKHKAGVGVVADVAKAFSAKIESGYTYATNTANTTAQYYGEARELDLSTGKDVLKGSALSDFFKAYIQNNDNTLQSGDVLDGGAGRDVLFADIGNSQQFAITAETKSIEDVKIRAQAIGPDSAENNLAGKSVKIDAERMQDVLNWENNRSRADLVIEDVNINDNQITKDITITMRDTNPGHVDYGVYFDQNSLRFYTQADSQLNLRVLDTKNTNLEGKPSLKDSPYGSFTFYAKATGSSADFTKFTFASQEMQDAQTLEEMVTALQKAADAQLGAGAVTVSLGNAYTVVDSVSGNPVQAKEIVIKAHGNITFDTTLPGSGWLATEVVPPSSGLYTGFNTSIQIDEAPVTSQVVLDYVGRGSNGGDLVIGGLSVGDTSGSKGVQRFEIEVQDDSRLQTISSTNNTLREVEIKNGKTDRNVDAYSTLEKDAGMLRVNGQVPVSLVPGVSTPLPGGSTSQYGFQDVRLIDGSAMKGKLEFTAELTAESLDKYVKSRSKYLSLEDIQANPLTDDVDVAYSGGANDDKIVADIDNTIIASNSNIKVGMADFNFAFNGNEGNDYISVAIARAGVTTTKEGAEHVNKDLLGFDTIVAADAGVLKGDTEVWYANQRSNNMREYGNYGVNAVDIDTEADFSRDKMVISGGAGDDDLRKPGAGDVTIDAGAGNDVIYADNTGAEVHAIGGAPNMRTKAAYVFNTANQAVAGDDSQIAGNLESAPLVEVGSWGVTVEVNYRGLTSKRIAIDDTTDFRATQLDVNQAIKKAINDDPVLSKLLLAQDDPSGTLIVASKVDDAHVEGALQIRLHNPDAATVTQQVVDQFNVKNPTVGGVANPAALLIWLTNNVTGVGVGSLADTGYNDTRLARNDGNTADIAGDKSVTTSDNIIKPGAGDDVVVLGTTDDGGSELGSSNDVVKFEGVFDNDTIVNFSLFAANGNDYLDFRSYFRAAGPDATDAVATTYNHFVGGAVGGLAVTEAEIVVYAWDTTDPDRNDSEAAVRALYNDANWVAGPADPAVRNELYVAEKANGQGVVYHVQDGAGTGDLKVTLLGSIDFASDAGVAIDNSRWDNLTANEFI